MSSLPKNIRIPLLADTFDGFQLKGMGWLRDPIDPRDFSLEDPKVNKILTSNNNKKTEG
jgi:hypothetical protein